MVLRSDSGSWWSYESIRQYWSDWWPMHAPSSHSAAFAGPATNRRCDRLVHCRRLLTSSSVSKRLKEVPPTLWNLT